MSNSPKIKQKPQLPTWQQRWELAKLGPPLEGTVIDETPDSKVWANYPHLKERLARDVSL